MNRITMLLLLTFALPCASARAQGTSQGVVYFRNFVPAAGLNAPFTESDGVTRLSGSQFMVELFGGTTLFNFQALALTNFLTGSQAGYFDGGVVSVPRTLPGDLAYLYVEVWNTATGSTFSEAQHSGLGNSWAQSPNSLIFTGSPAAPAALTGMLPAGQTFIWLGPIPEPSSLALLLAAGLAFVIRRKYSARPNVCK